MLPYAGRPAERESFHDSISQRTFDVEGWPLSGAAFSSFLNGALYVLAASSLDSNEWR